MGGVTGLLSGGLGLAKSAAGGKGGGKGGAGGGGGGSDPQSAYQYMENLNKIRSRYADLGLGGSTMEAQDEAGAGLANLASQANIQNQSTQTGLNALSTLSGIQNQQQPASDFQAGTQSANTGGTTGSNPAGGALY